MQPLTPDKTPAAKQETPHTNEQRIADLEAGLRKLQEETRTAVLNNARF